MFATNGLLACAYLSVAAAHAILPRQASTANNTTSPKYIDVHAHFTPDFYRTAVGTALPGGNPLLPWNVSTHLALAAQQGIGRTILTPPTPNVLPNNQSLTVSIARQLNDFAANLTRTYPNDFSFFSVLPLPFVNDTLVEIQRAKSIGAIGFAMFSNSEGRYPGDPEFAPVWKAVNDLNMTVFIHPYTPSISTSCGVFEANPLGNVTPVATLEFFADTTRAFTDLILRGVLANNTNLRFLVPQVGGDFPATLDRTLTYLTGFLRQPQSVADNVYNIIKTRFFYESAGPSYPRQVYGILGYDVPWSQMMLGTDYPAIPAQAVIADTALVVNFTGFGSTTNKNNVLYGNAAQLWNLTS